MLQNERSWTHGSVPIATESQRFACMAGELQALYRESMCLEAAFFGEQPGLPRPPAVGVLVVDFDETCTAADTTGVIIGAAIAEAERRAGGAQAAS